MNNNYFTSEYYHVSDLALAAALICKSHEPVEIDKSNKQRVVFIFCNNQDVKRSAQDFLFGRCLVDAKSYFDNIKHLKSQLYMR